LIFFSLLIINLFSHWFPSMWDIKTLQNTFYESEEGLNKFAYEIVNPNPKVILNIEFIQVHTNIRQI